MIYVNKNTVPAVILFVASAVAIFVPFCRWAVNSELIGRDNAGFALFFSFAFPLAIYFSCVVALISLILLVVWHIKYRGHTKILLISVFVSLFPILYLLTLGK